MRTYSAVLGLGEEEKKDSKLDEAPDAEDNVGPPLNILKSNRDTELGGKQGNGSEERREGHALGTHFVGEHLDRDKGLHRGPANRVANLEEVHPGKNSLADGARDGRSLSLIVDVGDVGDGGGNNDTNPAKTAGNVGSKEQGTTTNVVDQRGTEGSRDDLDGAHTELNVRLVGAALDTSGVEEATKVVGDNACDIHVSLAF